MSKTKDYIYDREAQIARDKKYMLIVQVLVLMFAAFVMGYYTCTQVYFEFPLDATVYFEGYHERPLYGHYGEFMDSFRIKEN